MSIPHIRRNDRNERKDLFRREVRMRLESILKIINILAALGMQRETGLTASPLSPSETAPCVRFHPVPRAAQAWQSEFFSNIKKREPSAGDHTLWPTVLTNFHPAEAPRGGGGAVCGADTRTSPLAHFTPLSTGFLWFPNKDVEIKDRKSLER